MIKSAGTLFLFIALLSAAAAQERLTFEAATVRPVDPKAEAFNDVAVRPGGRVIINGFSLKSLISLAFHIPWGQISGGEAWMGDSQYHVEAVPPLEWQTKITNLKHSYHGIDDPHLREMLQSLLIERFHLKYYIETKAGTVYALKRAGKSLGLRPTEAVGEGPEGERKVPVSGNIGYAGGKWVFYATSMPQLANFAGTFVVHAPVKDETGLDEVYDYRQKVPDEAPNYSDNTDSFLRMLSEVGLKLERRRGPVETLVIESAAKPTVN